MIPTRQVIDLLKRANPSADLTEDRVRHALRRGDLTAPALVAGRLLWTESDIRALAVALGLAAPTAAIAAREEVSS